MNKIEDYGLKAVTLTREGEQLLITAVSVLHAGKAVVQIAAVKITIDHLLDIGPPEPILP
jgi:hypothetical protein